MSIQENIKKIAQQMGISYIYHNWATVNQIADNVELPVMINVLPVSGAFRLDGYSMRDSASCLIAFLDKTDYDFDAEENDEVVERMKKRAKQFLIALNASGEVEEIDLQNVPYEVVYDKLDVNLTGIVLDLQITQSGGECINGRYYEGIG